MEIICYSEKWHGEFFSLVSEFRSFNAEGFSEEFDPEIAIEEARERVRACTKGDDVLLLALSGGKAIGFVQFGLLKKPPFLTPKKQKVGYISALYVTPCCRGQGYGLRLFDAAEKDLASAGAEHVDLVVTVFNDSSRRFYESRGYKVEHLRMSRRLAETIHKG